MIKKWVKITARIILVSFTLHSYTTLANADFSGSVTAGTTLGDGLLTSGVSGMSEGATNSPQSTDASSEQSSYSSYYTDLNSATSTTASSTTAGTYIEDTSTREIIDLTNDPTFGNACLETDASGTCTKWSTSTEIFLTEYSDCTAATTVAGAASADTYVELTEPTVENSTETYQYQWNIYPQVTTNTGTPCSSVTPTPLSGDQIYSSCKDTITNGTPTSIVETLSLTQQTVTSGSSWVTVYDVSISPPGDGIFSDVRMGCTPSTTPSTWEEPSYTTWAASGFGWANAYNMCPSGESYTDGTYYLRTDRGFAGISTDLLDNTIFLYGGQLTKITITVDDTGDASGGYDPWAVWLIEVMDQDMNLIYATDGRSHFNCSRQSYSYTFPAYSTGNHTVRIFRGNEHNSRTIEAKVEKLETTYTLGTTTEPAGMANAVANCTLKSTRAYDSTWNTYVEAVNDGTAASATIPANTTDTRICQNYAGANTTYNLCLQSVQVSMDGGVTALPASIETSSNSTTQNTCSMRSDTETYTVPCTCGDRGGSVSYLYYPTNTCYSGVDIDNNAITCGTDEQVRYLFDGDISNDVTCTSTATATSWETKVIPNGLYNWHGQATFTCAVEVTPTYQSYLDEGCTLYSTQCQDTACDNSTYTFKCPPAEAGATGTSTVSYNCGGMTVECIGDDCKDVSYENNSDLASVAASGEVLENAQFDSNETEVFPGKAMSCQRSPKPCCKAAAPDSCGIQCYITAYKAVSAAANSLLYESALNAALTPLGVSAGTPLVNTTISNGVATTTTSVPITNTSTGVTSMVSSSTSQSSTMYYASTALSYVAWAYTAYQVANMLYELQFGCDQDDVMTSFSLGYSLCYKTGETCTSSVGGTCLSKDNDYCCFSSILARLIHEQGRPQLGMDWSSCRGFSVEELSSLDFSQIDLSEYMQYVEDNLELTDIDATNYSCPNGGTLSGSTCSQYSTTDPATCGSGWTLNGTRCEQAATITYECPTGTTLEGTTCTYSTEIIDRNSTNADSLGSNIDTQMTY